MGKRKHGRADTTIEFAGHLNQEELVRRFDGWWGPVLELIQATPLTALVRNEVFDRGPSRKCGQGSMTLLGDAIHPTTPNLGQGGCLAIEDAAVLASWLHQHAANSGIPFALRHYENSRFARSSAIARYSRIYGAIGQWENRLAVWMRNRVLSFVPRSVTDKLFRQVFDYDAYALLSNT